MLNLTPSEQHAAARCAHLTQQHPRYPRGQRVRDRMSGHLGTVSSSAPTRVHVAWDHGHFVGNYDGWQAGNSLQRIKS